MYGLNDAPVAWQLSLGQFLKKQKGTPSHLDDSFFFWKDPKSTPSLKALLTTHVDDLAVVGSSTFLDELYASICKEFGKVTRDQLPFSHCGCLYSRTTNGLKIDQTAFASRLKPAPEPQGADDRKLTPAELTQFRSVLGGLLWLCSTRLDLIADVGILQSAVADARVKHLRQANVIVKKATMKDRINLGLHYRFMNPKCKLRLQCIHDASSASKGKCYAQEGVLVVLMPELDDEMLRLDEMTCDQAMIQKLSSFGHILFAHGGKAKRVSYSTSHAETLSAINGLEASGMVSTRLTELWLPEQKPTLQQLTIHQENGSMLFPVDTATDCRDFFELSTGSKAIPQDRMQRLYILAFKEARVTGRIRYLMLIPTTYMLADPLTKPMTSRTMMQALSSGYIEFGNEGDHCMTLRRLPTLSELQEEDLFHDDETIKSVAATRKKSSPSFAGLAM